MADVMRHATGLRLAAAALATLCCLAGCAGRESVVTVEPGAGSTSAGPLAGLDAARALAGAADASIEEHVPVDMIELVAPRLESWPRSMRGGGPYYVLMTAAPYVGHFGAVADGERAGDGSGYGVTLGRRTPRSSSKTLGIEITYEMSEHFNDHSDVDAAATRAGLGLSWGFSPMCTVQPFVAAGAGWYALDFDDMDDEFDIAGAGGYLGGGVDALLSRSFAVRIEARAHAWAAEDGTGAGGVTETVVVSLGVQAAF